MITLTFQSETAAGLRKSIADYLNSGVAVEPAPSLVEVAKTETASNKPEVAKQGKGAKAEPTAASPQPDAAVEHPAESPTTDKASSSGSASDVSTGEVPYSEVRTAVLRLSIAKGREAVFDLFKRYGAEKNAEEIDPSRRPELLAEIETLIGA